MKEAKGLNLIQFSAGLLVGFIISLGVYLIVNPGATVSIPVSNEQIKLQAAPIVIDKDTTLSRGFLAAGYNANSAQQVANNNPVKVNPGEQYVLHVLEIGKTVGEVRIDDCDIAWNSFGNTSPNIFSDSTMGALYLGSRGELLLPPVLSTNRAAQYTGIEGSFKRNYQFNDQVNTRTNTQVEYTTIAFQFTVSNQLNSGDRFSLAGVECPISGDNGLSDRIVVQFRNNEVLLEVSGSTDNALVPLYQFYNADTGAHFYTASESQKQSVLDRFPQFKPEGIAYYVSTGEGRGVYRFYNSTSGAHFYTADVSTRDQVLERFPQFKLENGGQPVFYVNADISSGFPVYQFYNATTGAHFYTADEVKKNAVENRFPQFKYEKVTYSVSKLD